MLRELAKKDHPHIIKLLATYRLGRLFSFDVSNGLTKTCELTGRMIQTPNGIKKHYFGIIDKC